MQQSAPQGPAKAAEGDPLLKGRVEAVPPPQSPMLRAWHRVPVHARVCIVILVEMALSISLNFYNSFLLRHVPGFNFPVIYTMVHMITSFLGSGVFVWCDPATTVSWGQFSSFWQQIVTLALLRGASITTNNWSLQYIDLPLNKVIKASAPIFTVLLSVAVERKTYSWRKVLALCGLALGTAMSCVSQTHQQHAVGIALALCSAVVGGSSIVVSAMLLLGSNSKLGPINLLFYFSPIQTAVLATIVPFTELHDFIAWSRANLQGAVLYILVGSLLSFGFNVMGFVLVQCTSSITTAMLGNLKIVLVILLAAFFLGAAADPINIAGYCVTTLAAFAYTLVNLHERGQLPCTRDRGGEPRRPQPAP